MKTIVPLPAVVAALTLSLFPVNAQNYTVSYTNGGTWSTVYAQGFSTSLGATPVPSVSIGDPVDLTQFEFFKSGNADTAANVQLAIFNTMYPNTVGLTTADSSFVGLSDNTIAGTGGLATGDPIAFTFNNLPLTYGNDYSAVFVNVGGGGALTPVLVSALTANYVDVGGGDWHPESNYGTETDWQYVTSDYISGGYFSAYTYAGDANFSASLTAVPEPTSALLLWLGGLLFVLGRRGRMASTSS